MSRDVEGLGQTPEIQARRRRMLDVIHRSEGRQAKRSHVAAVMGIPYRTAERDIRAMVTAGLLSGPHGVSGLFALTEDGKALRITEETARR